jgi:hypothetical protein
MPRRILSAAALSVLALLLAGGTAGAQDGGLRFEKTVPFERGELITLGAQVGPVRIANVELSMGSSGGGPGGGIRERIMGGMPGGGDPETRTTITARFDTENPREEEWVVTYTLDFLDSKGKLIDRASKSKGFEGEARVFDVEHSTLSYVVPFISKVRIRLEAKYD